MSSSKGSEDGSSDGTQDWKVDWLRNISSLSSLVVQHSYLEARLLHRQRGTTVAKVPVPRSSSFDS